MYTLDFAMQKEKSETYYLSLDGDGVSFGLFGFILLNLMEHA